MIKHNLLLLLLGPILAVAQHKDEAPTPLQSRYITVGLGRGATIIRDRATSPLFYKGSTSHLQFGLLRMNSQKETEVYFSIDKGELSNSFGTLTHSSTFNSISLSYGRLYPLPLLTSKKWISKIGGRFVSTGTLRINPSLENNALGVEAFFNLLASFKVSRDISILKEKTKKFLWIKRTKQPRKRSLDFKMDLGIINSNYRNGFIYGDQSQVLNNPRAFDGHEFNFVSGLRFATQLDYVTYLENGNAIRLGYHWDALTSGESRRSYDMASHTFSVGLLFHTKSVSK